MNETEQETKVRNREIAENEAERQTVGDIRVSAWAIAVAVAHRSGGGRLGVDPQQLARWRLRRRAQ